MLHTLHSQAIDVHFFCICKSYISVWVHGHACLMVPQVAVIACYAFLTHFTALLQIWHGYFALGPGFNSTWPPRIRRIESCWKLLPLKFVGQGLCLRNKFTDLIHSYVLDVVTVLLVSSVSLIETFSLTVYMMVNNNTSSRFIVSAVSLTVYMMVNNNTSSRFIVSAVSTVKI